MYISDCDNINNDCHKTPAIMQIRGIHWCRLEQKFDSQMEIDTHNVIVKDSHLLSLLWRLFPFIFRLPDRCCSVLLQVCKERKWKAFGDLNGSEEENLSWNLWWRTSTPKSQRTSKLRKWQIINHIPNSANYCKKDVLVRYLRRMIGIYGNIYEFCPISFNLPTEFSQLIIEHRKRKSKSLIDSDSEENVVWIAKPVGKSQGKGIFVFERCSELRYDDQYVVQEYIHKPLLINGYKWDLRLYVCITCKNPLTIYAYQEGIVRFATRKYDLSDLQDTFSHLTNTSINKQSPSYYKHKDTVGLGSKWSLSQLRTYFRKEGIQDYYLWQKIWSILVLTIVGEGKGICQQEGNGSGVGFQFLGFDVLVNENLRPYLLEVNIHPGLATDRSSSVDFDVKVPLLHEMFDLIGLPDGRCFPELSEMSVLEVKTEISSKIVEASKVESMYGRPSYLASPTPSRDSDQSYRRKSASQGKSILRHKISGTPSICTRTRPYRECSKTGRMKTSSPSRSRKFRPLVARIPSLAKSKSRLNLPVNGPGLTFTPRQWETDAPITCGKWAKIFPFDSITLECSTFQQSGSGRDVINRVSSHLQQVRDVLNQKKQQDDKYFDEILEKSLITNVWHPS